MRGVLSGLCAVELILHSGCGHRVESAAPSVRDIRIAEAAAPDPMFAKPGEEVRWTNVRSAPVRIGYLTVRLLEELGCERGVKTLFGQVNDLITIPAGESISLCFGRVGELKYKLWF